jgi:two-component system sensor histidine kinase TorS
MVAVSAHVFNEEVENYLASGFDGFLPKPLEKEALAQLIVTQLDGNTLLLQQPDPNDFICSQNNKPQRNKGNELYSSQMASVVSDLAIKASQTEDEGETPVKLIDSNVIKGDLSILGLDKMKQIVGLFEESSRVTLSEMVEASDSDNGREVKSLAHKLKGSAGSLGLLQLYNACQVIETSQEPLQQYREDAEALVELAKDSLIALKQHV